MKEDFRARFLRINAEVRALSRQALKCEWRERISKSDSPAWQVGNPLVCYDEAMWGLKIVVKEMVTILGVVTTDGTLQWNVTIKSLDGEMFAHQSSESLTEAITRATIEALRQQEGESL